MRNLYLGGEVLNPFVIYCPPLLDRPIWLPLTVQLSGNAHKDFVNTVVIAFVHWHLCGKTRQVVSAIIIFSLLLAAIACWLEQHSRHVSCVLIGTHHKLAACVQLHRYPLNEAWVWAGRIKWSLPRYPKGQSIKPASRSMITTCITKSNMECNYTISGYLACARLRNSWSHLQRIRKRDCCYYRVCWKTTRYQIWLKQNKQYKWGWDFFLDSHITAQSIWKRKRDKGHQTLLPLVSQAHAGG